MDVKLELSPLENWWCLWTRCWGEYLDL